MGDTWSERLSEYLDGELPEAEARLLESHLLECEDCRRSLTELRIVIARLAADPLAADDQPTDRKWAAIRRSMPVSRGRWKVPTAIAAALIGMALIGGLLARRGGEESASASSQASVDLEAILRENEDRLRPETVRALKASLATIDSAIAQAERVLAADSANDYVTRSVGQLQEARLATLRRAVAVVHIRS